VCLRIKEKKRRSKRTSFGLTANALGSIIALRVAGGEVRCSVGRVPKGKERGTLDSYEQAGNSCYKAYKGMRNRGGGTEEVVRQREWPMSN